MAAKKTNNAEREFIIGKDAYIIYKENGVSFVKLNDNVVFSSKNDPKTTVSRFLKSIKNKQLKK